MTIDTFNALVSEIRSAREEGDEVRVFQLLAQIAPERLEEAAHIAQVTMELASTLKYARDLLSRFDEEDGEVTDPYWLIRDAADLATMEVWRPVVGRIMREALARLPKWKKVAEGPGFLWCTGAGDISEIAQRATTVAAVYREDSDQVAWLEPLDEDADAEDGVEYDAVYKTCWDADPTGAMIYVQPTADGEGWEVWANWV